MTTFEEQFPSLKNKRLKYKDMCEDHCLSEECDVNFDTNYYYNEADVLNKCLDKQKVREAIMNMRKFYDSEEYDGKRHWASLLIEELGL